MQVGDLVKVTIENGFVDIGLIMKVEDSPDGPYYDVACEQSKTECIATEDMLEVINEAG